MLVRNARRLSYHTRRTSASQLTRDSTCINFIAAKPLMISCVPLTVTPLNSIACWKRSELLYDTRRISASPFTRDSTCFSRIAVEDARRCRTPVEGYFFFAFHSRPSAYTPLSLVEGAAFLRAPGCATDGPYRCRKCSLSPHYFSTYFGFIFPPE